MANCAGFTEVFGDLSFLPVYSGQMLALLLTRQGFSLGLVLERESWGGKRKDGRGIMDKW
jgi:hypothetical protein